MSTVEQIEEAIRALPARERDRLAKDPHKVLPELDGEAARDRIIHEERPRPAFSRLLDEVDAVPAPLTLQPVCLSSPHVLLRSSCGVYRPAP